MWQVYWIDPNNQEHVIPCSSYSEAQDKKLKLSSENPWQVYEIIRADEESELFANV